MNATNYLLPKQAQELLRGSFKLFEELKVPTSEPLSNENTVTWSPSQEYQQASAKLSQIVTF
jgi:hypothetical protein